jgi:phage-related protein
MVTLGDKLFSVFDSSGYIPFSYYGESEYTYHVFNADLVETERLLRTSWVRVYTYNLSAAAFKYFDPGQRRNVSNGDTLVNPFEYEAKPYIKLMGTGNVTLTIAGKAYNYAGVDGFLEIDSDELQQDLYKTNADGTVTFQNEKAQASQAFPTLQKGRNLISWSGNITNLEIEPRWRSI